MRSRIGVSIVGIGLAWVTLTGATQREVLVVDVTDLAGTPVGGLLLSADGGDRAETDGAGRVALPLRGGTSPGDWVVVDIASPSAAEDLVWVTPWDRQLPVPSPDDPPPHARLVVEERGSRRLLDAEPALIEQIVTRAAGLAVDAESFDATLVATIEAVATRYELGSAEVDEAIRAWGTTAATPYDRGLSAFYELEFAEAADSFSAALEQADAAASVTPGTIFTRARLLGYARWAEGRHAEAAAAFARAGAIRDGDPHVLNAWGRALLGAGRHADAERTLQYGLTTASRTAAPEDLGPALLSHTLGRLFQRQGQYARSQRFYEGALALAEPVLGDIHPTLGGWLDELAGLYLAQQRTAEAQTAQARSLAIAETWWGSNHPVVGDRLNGLAVIHDAQGRQGEAEQLYRRALAIAETAYGPTHPTVGIRLNNLAMNYQAQRRYAEADALFTRALAVFETAYGPTHSNVAAVLQNHSMLLREMGRPEEGAELERRAVAASGRSRD